MRHPRLDILIYAHDGRGLGHVSRSAAIGMALRRLYPALRVCLMTGCRQTQELIGPAPLDWLKLPAYETEVVGGVSRGINGPSNYTDRELAAIRQDQILHVFSLYRPRLFLTDHTPQGKHKELVPALASLTTEAPTVCVLGMRGVVGAVPQTSLPLVQDLFRNHFSKLLWYGDDAVLGHEHRDLLSKYFSTRAIGCGYVSRMAELNRLYPDLSTAERQIACTISIPWLGEDSEGFVENLADALQRLGPDFGMFQLYIGSGASAALINRLNHLDGCTVKPFGSSYAQSLCQSKSAIIFGGYNSVVDVIAVRVPALVVLRDMRDQEQQKHLEALTRSGGTGLTVVDEKRCTSELIYLNLLALLAADRCTASSHGINLDGAAQAAHVLAASLGDVS